MEDKDATSGGGKTPRRRWIVYGLLGAGALVTLVAARPIAAAVQEAEQWHGRFAGHFGHHSLYPDAAREHLQVAARWALRDVDATPEQQEKVNAIVASAVTDLFALKDRHLANRDALHQQLVAEKVDRAALEETRKAEMEVADEASKRFVQAVADISDVLTPEQRQALAERIHHLHGG